MSVTGLRAKQREVRREKMRDVARTLFAKNGYHETTVEMIAAAAEVSPPTVYKFFRTKAGLLTDIITEADRRTIRESEEALNNPQGSAEEEIQKLLVLMVEKSLAAVDAQTWRHAIATALTDTDSDIGLSYRAQNAALYDVVERQIQILIDTGKLRKRAGTLELRGLLENLNHSLFTEIVSGVGISFEDYRDRVLPSYLQIILRQYI